MYAKDGPTIGEQRIFTGLVVGLGPDGLPGE
jgi:hypothetical protein